MAAYNHERYVASAIQSVLDQNYHDWELVIVDDCSTDNTPEIIRGFNDPRIRFYRHEHNQGIAATTKDCLEKSEGEFIAILNSDDQYRPAKLEKQVTVLESQPEVGAVFTHTWFINRQGGDYNKLNIGFYSNRRNIFNRPNHSRHEWLNHFFYHGNTLCDPSVMARRKVYTEIAPPDPRFPIAGDFHRWVRLCLHQELYIIPEILVNFRIHGKNASGDWLGPQPKIAWELLLTLRNYREITDPEELRKIFPEILQEMELDRDLIPYYLSLPALKVPSLTHRLFAVEILSDLLQDEVKAAKLRQKHGFDYHDLRELYRKI
jgi:glycosyltransferase involved in cell wall biosynthesis